MNFNLVSYVDYQIYVGISTYHFRTCNKKLLQFNLLRPHHDAFIVYSCKQTSIGVGLEIMSNTGDRFCAVSISSFIFSFGATNFTLKERSVSDN